MKIIVTAFGSAGDLVPVLAIAQAATQRGHDVVALVNPSAVRMTQARGVRAVAFGEPWDTAEIAKHPHWLHPAKGSLAMLKELMAPRAAALVPALRTLCEEFAPDVIVYHQASFGAPWVADESGIPRAMVTVAPAGWPSVENPNLYPPMPDRERYPAWTVRLGSVFGRRSVNRAVDPVLNAIRRDLGLPPSRAFMFEDQVSPWLNIGMWSPVFRGPASDDPPNALVAGFPRAVRETVGGTGEADEELDRVRAFLAADDEAPVAVTLGTTAVHAGADLAALAGELRARIGRRVLVLGGAGGEVGEGVLCAGFVPHGEVLPRCAAVVHHGGIGTAAQTLRAGVPAVVVPFTHDQPDNARRLRRLGVARVVAPKRLSGEVLARELGGVLGGDSGEREAVGLIAAALEGEDGGVSAFGAVERLWGSDGG